MATGAALMCSGLSSSIRFACFGLACLGLAGCDSRPIDTPVTWWHNLEGGQIAAQRPPPPGVDQPFPKLGTVPARPQIPDPVTRQRLEDELLAERDTAERIAARNPVVVPPAPPAPAATPAAAVTTEAATATLGAASATSTPLPTGASAPPAGKAANTGARADQGNDAAAAGPDINADAGVILAGGAADASGLPPIPPAPPSPPAFEGMPAEPPPSPPPPVPKPLPRAARGTEIRFPPGSAQLLRDQSGTLRAIATHRGGGALAITGYGDAQSDAPAAQAAALTLALQRAEAVAVALQGFGVPQSALRIDADAFGRGAAVRLVQ